MLKKIFEKTSDYTGYSYEYLKKKREKIAVSIIAGCLGIGIVSVIAFKSITVYSAGRIQAVQEQSITAEKKEIEKMETIVLTTSILKSNSDDIVLRAAERNKKIRLEAEARQKEEATKAELKKKEAQKPRYVVSRGRSPIEMDTRLLEKIVMAEAGGEPYEGQVAVANVVLNRVSSRRFPNTIRGVIFQRGQFSPVGTGRIYKVSPSKSVKNAVRAALNGEQAVPSGTLYFLNKNTANDLTIPKTKTFVKRIGNHWFYK